MALPYTAIPSTENAPGTPEGPPTEKFPTETISNIAVEAKSESNITKGLSPNTNEKIVDISKNDAQVTSLADIKDPITYKADIEENAFIESVEQIKNAAPKPNK